MTHFQMTLLKRTAQVGRKTAKAVTLSSLAYYDVCVFSTEPATEQESRSESAYKLHLASFKEYDCKRKNKHFERRVSNEQQNTRVPHLLVPVLAKPDHLIDDALQRRQQRGMEVPLHVHDPAAAPHRGGGADRPTLAARRLAGCCGLGLRFGV